MNKYLVKLAEGHASKYGKHAMKRLSRHIESAVMGGAIGGSAGYIKGRATEEKKKFEERKKKRQLTKSATRRWPGTLGYVAVGSTIGAGLGALDSKTRKLDKKDTKSNVIRNAAGYGLIGGLVHRAGLKGKLETNKFIRRTKRYNSSYNEAYKQYRSKYKFKGTVGPVHRDLKAFGTNAKSFKTKKEVERHFKTHLHKAHPDKSGGDTKKFQQLSTARDRLMKSDWFKKLAMQCDDIINKILKVT